MEETMRTKIDVLKQKVLNRAEIARRWFKFKGSSVESVGNVWLR